MKSNLILMGLLLLGFAFVYMEDERDAEDAIRRLDQYEFGRNRRRLRVEWTKVITVNFYFLIEIYSLLFYSSY